VASIGDLREIACRRTRRAVFDDTDSSADSELTLRRAREAVCGSSSCPASYALSTMGTRSIENMAAAPPRYFSYPTWWVLPIRSNPVGHPVSS
jgi:hypothetical protein